MKIRNRLISKIKTFIPLFYLFIDFIDWMDLDEGEDGFCNLFFKAFLLGYPIHASCIYVMCTLEYLFLLLVYSTSHYLIIIIIIIIVIILIIIIIYFHLLGILSISIIY